MTTQKLEDTKNKKNLTKEIKFIFKIAFAIIFFILGFNFSNSLFFKEFPLFGIRFMAEVFISFASGLFGFFVFPKLLMSLKNWVEVTITKTIKDVFNEFWEQQTKRIEENKKEKKKIQAEKQKKQFENAILVDTSVIIDARILKIVKAGFITNNLIVAKSVIKELQQIADSKDKIKRQRGRNGLDVLNKLKKETKVFITEINGREKEVDLKLVEFCKNHKLPLFTLDFNLIKVANVSGVKILNINELVESLKTVYLPGEIIEIEIIQKGKEKKQGIGYLEDGTMVVIEDCIDKVGQKVFAQVVKVIQSKAGKMFFCKLKV